MVFAGYAMRVALTWEDFQNVQRTSRQINLNQRIVSVGLGEFPFFLVSQSWKKLSPVSCLDDVFCQVP